MHYLYALQIYKKKILCAYFVQPKNTFFNEETSPHMLIINNS